MAKETAFVLVHGAWWGGDWFWRGVADRLRAEGHRVFTPMLTGLGSRAHLKDCGVDLSLHIMDIVNLIEWEELTDIVLVGHSYAGMVVSGAVEKLPEGTVRSIVFLDAFLPENGEALTDIASNFKDLAGDHDPVPPPVFFAGDNEELKAVLEKRGSPQPRACFEERAAITGARERIAIKTYVLATTGEVFTRFFEKTKADPSWRTETVSCAHFPMLEAPGETAEILLRAME